jgi:hypothetical protein
VLITKTEIDDWIETYKKVNEWKEKKESEKKRDQPLSSPLYSSLP